MIIACACEVYGGDALECAKAIARGTKTPCACECHRATHEAASLPKGRLEWLERCEAAIQSMAGQFCSPKTTPEQFVADALGEKAPGRRASR